MPIKTFRPTTPTRRFHTVVSREGISKSKPEKSLVESRTRSGGRNSTGRVTSRFIGVADPGRARHRADFHALAALGAGSNHLIRARGQGGFEGGFRHEMNPTQD